MRIAGVFSILQTSSARAGYNPEMASINSPTVIFFDLDETLINNASGVEAMITGLFDSHLSALGPENQARFIQALTRHAGTMWQRMFEPGMSGRSVMVESFRQAIRSVGGDTDTAAGMFEQFIEMATKGARPCDNAIEVLQAVRDLGITTGIITNGFRELQTAKIKYHGFHELIDQVVISEQAGAHKPDQKIFEYALALVDEEAVNAWHIGDHPVNDIRGAAGAGITGIHYDPTGNWREQEYGEPEQRPVHTIANLEEVLTLLPARPAQEQAY